MMPDSVVKMLDAGVLIKKEPDDKESPEPIERTAKNRRPEDQEPINKQKKLNVSDGDLRQMTSNDLRNLRDEHGTNWNKQDYERIQTVLKDRASGKTYERKDLGEEEKPLTMSEKVLKGYTDQFDSFNLGDGSGEFVDWSQRSQPVQKMSEGGLVKGGSGTRDDVPALLQGGEFVTTKETVQTLGAEFFENQNKATSQSEAVSSSAQQARDKVTKEMLKEIKETNELQKASMKQQQQLAKIHGETLQATRDLLNKSSSNNVITNTSASFNVSTPTTIKDVRQASRR